MTNNKPLNKMTKTELMVLIQQNGLFVNDPGITVKTPVDIVAGFINKAPKRAEGFMVATLNAAHNVIKIHRITSGTVNSTMVHPRDVFYAAIKDNAAAIIIGHNHPSGNLIPSNNDNEVTQRIKDAGNILGIPLLDHVIVAKDGQYRSYLEHGEL